METFSFKINGTRFECVADPDALGEDILGDCEFRFDAELARLLAPVVWHEANDFRSFDGTLAESQENRTGEEWEDGEPLRLEADGGIRALCVLAELGERDGEPWRFEWDGSGSAFWLFHDVTHAAEDFGAWEEDGTWHVEASQFPAVLAWNEDRANLEGARRAIRAGVAVDEVLAELANVAEPFSDRFAGEESTALDDLLASGELADVADVTEEDFRAYVEATAVECEEGTDPDEDPDGWEWIGDGTALPAWAVLTFADFDGRDVGDESATVTDRAFYALAQSVTARACELREDRNAAEEAEDDEE